MKKFFVNNTAQAVSRDHEVHEEGCYWLGLAYSTSDLGYHPSCSTAVAQAKLLYPALSRFLWN